MSENLADSTLDAVTNMTVQYLVHFILEILKDVVTLGQSLLKLVIFFLIHCHLPPSRHTHHVSYHNHVTHTFHITYYHVSQHTTQ